MKKILFLAGLLTLFISCASNMTIGGNGKRRDLQEGQRLTIEGVVTDTIQSHPGEEGMYRVFDEDYQSLWVLTDKLPLPERGARVRVSGVLRKRDDIKKRLFGLILTEKRRKVLEETTS